MKTLVIKYTPRQNSNTEKLLEIFLEKVNKSEVKIRDLAKNVPPLLLENSLNSYIKRKYDKELSSEDIENLKEMDDLTNEFLSADRVVIAYPIYNYSMPAVVKAWFDAIVQKGFTFGVQDTNNKKELANKEIFIINTSGSTQFDSSSDLSSPLVRRIFSLMGITKIHFLGVMAINFVGFSDENLKTFENDLEKLLN